MNTHKALGGGQEENLLPLPQSDHLRCLQHGISVIGDVLKGPLPDDKRSIILTVSGLIEVIHSRGSNEEVQNSVKIMATMIDDMMDPLRGLVEASQRQMDEMQLELETRGALSTSIPLDKIDAEIARHEEEARRISGVQEDLEDERDGLRDKIASMKTSKTLSDDPRAITRQLEKLEAEIEQRQQKIARVIKGLAESKEFVRRLKQYKASLEVVAKGVDETEFGRRLVRGL